MPPRTPTALIGAAGEYFVAAELSRRGWLATVTIKNAPGTDVLAQHADRPELLVAIQTKTTTGKDSWLLSKKDETPTSATHEWYVLVAMGALADRPSFYVMPRNHVAAYLWVGHRNWLANSPSPAQSRKDSSMRNVFLSEIQHYRERWDALEEPSGMEFVPPGWWAKAVEVVSEHHDWPQQAQLLGFGPTPPP